MDLLTIGGVAISGTNPCRFIAEVGANHNGDYETAVRLVEAAKATGAEFVKFQAYTMAEILGLRGDGPAPEPWAGQTLEQLYERARTPLEWLAPLFQYARDIGIVPFASVFGLESMIALEKCACPAYKVARYDTHSGPLVELALSRKKPVLASYDPYEVGHLDRHFPMQHRVHQLMCPKGYPATEVKVPFFNYTTWIGLSSHCLDPFLPIAAVSRGAKVLEYHLQLDDEPAELDGSFSLTQSQFTQMVASVRQTERLLA